VRIRHRLDFCCECEERENQAQHIMSDVEVRKAGEERERGKSWLLLEQPTTTERQSNRNHYVKGGKREKAPSGVMVWENI
jgi:hypothetical protein